MANEVPQFTKEELYGLYELWGSLLATSTQCDAVAVWRERSINFDGLVDKWVSNLSRKLFEKENSVQQGGRPWQTITWGEALLRASEKF